MDKTNIVLIASVLIVLAIRLYLKYMKKNKSIKGVDNKASSGSVFSSSSKDDDYEPYSKR